MSDSPDNDDPDLEGAYALQTPDDHRRFYAAWAETYDADFVEGTGYASPARVAAAYAAANGSWPCLDVGCGTGAVARHMPDDALLDGLDLSPDMLAVAARLGRYRNLIEADLQDALPIADGAYAGLVSSGTFTHGHVGPKALFELVRCLAPGAVAVLGARPNFWEKENFARTFGMLIERGDVSAPRIDEHRLYAEGRAPDGHDDDTGYVVTFRRL